VEDERAPLPFRTRTKDFQESGFDRGHLAPAGDAPTQETLADTFVLSNISPQVGSGFNRDYWNRFEMFVRQLTLQNDEVYVATGPLFLPHQDSSQYGRWNISYDVIGKGNPPFLAVPTHFFKSIVCVRSQGSGLQFTTASFIIPNRSIAKNTSLQTFQG
jgi:endonuclease G